MFTTISNYTNITVEMNLARPHSYRKNLTFIKLIGLNSILLIIAVKSDVLVLPLEVHFFELFMH